MTHRENLAEQRSKLETAHRRAELLDIRYIALETAITVLNKLDNSRATVGALVTTKRETGRELELTRDTLRNLPVYIESIEELIKA